MSGDTATSQVFERVIDAIDANDVGYHEPRAGEVFDVGPLVIEVVSPENLTGHLNNGSIVTRLIYGNIVFLFTGDAEKEADRGMLNRGYDLKAHILKVGHHGSSSSTTSPFLEAVDPEVAIISAGKNNQYGHPHDETVSKLKNKGIDLYGTYKDGTIIIETDGNSYEVKQGKSPQSTSASGGGKSSIKKKGSSKKASSKAKASGDCIDINSASVEKLQEIIHIGPVRAEELIDLRPFDSVDDLQRINGIGPSRIEDIRSQGLACVGG